MDIHRSRFVPYPVWAVTAVAFSRPSDLNYTAPVPTLRLALGRADGTIEIWNPQRGQWVQESIFVGERNSIDDIVWTQDPDDTDAEGKTVPGQHRLFSIAASPDVTEWDLVTGVPKRRSTGNFSTIWAFAAQPRWRPLKSSTEEPQAQEMVAGCGDGTLVLLSTVGDDLQFKRTMGRVAGKRTKCMCLAYQTRERVVAGFADSMIRVYDTRNGTCLVNMILGEAVRDTPKYPLVWKVRCLPNGDIISGDSNGQVCIWDGKMYAQQQVLAAHDTDCLDLIASSDGKKIFSGSLDGKIAVLRLGKDGRGRARWAKQSHRRVHHGEVKAMAAFDGRGVSVVVSGGSDVTPMVTPLREYGKEHIRSLPGLPQEPPVTSAPRARLLVSWWDTDIYIWRIAKQSRISTNPELQRPRKLVARIALKTNSSIRSASISSDGKLLAVGTSAEVKVFQFRRRMGTDALAVRKLDVPDDLARSGARVLSFSPDTKWLSAVTLDSEVYVTRITTSSKKPSHLQILNKAAELDRQYRRISHPSAFKSYERSINRLAFSSDSSVLVAGDLSGFLDSWVLKGHENATAAAIDVAKNESDKDSFDALSDADSSSDDSDDDIVIFKGQHWADNPAGHLLLKLDSAPLVLSFRPTHTTPPLPNGNPGVHPTRHNPHAHSHALPQGTHNLFVITACHQMFELDVLSGRLSDWGRRNSTALLPNDFKIIRDRVMGCVWDTRGPAERIWLYGTSFLFMLDVGRDLAGANAAALPSARRKRIGGDNTGHSLSKMRKLESGAGDKVLGLEVSGEATLYEDGKKVDVAHPSRRDKFALPDVDDYDHDDDDEDEDGDAFPSQLAHASHGESDGQVEVRSSQDHGRPWWSTFKYRPILGMVALEDEDEGEDGIIEVALVERPLFDVQKVNT